MRITVVGGKGGTGETWACAPLMECNQAGIQVHHGGTAAGVGEAAQALLAGRLRRFTSEQTCGGGR